MNMKTEEWLNLTDDLSGKSDRIIAISNTGLMKRLNGRIDAIPYRQRIRYFGKLIRAYRLIAMCFLTTCKRQDQQDIDHITHNPVGMNINDVRNLRWCTKAENCQFNEHCLNLSNAKKGKPTWNKGKKGCQIAWNKGLHGAKYLEHYKLGRTFNSQLDAPKEG